MNWLAHLYLSEANPEFRLGNLLADIASVGSRLRRPVDFSESILALERDYESFHSDFKAFFPELSFHVCGFSGPTANR
jgi:acyl carrier protein phosphodiesterase